MDNQGTQTKGQNCRVQIKGDRPAEYFQQSIAVTSMDGVVYLRIGNDIYEGLPVNRSTDGTAIHFDLTGPSGAPETTNPGELTNYAVSDREYRFLAIGTMSSPVPPETTESVKNETDVEFPDLNFTEIEKSVGEMATLIGQSFTDAEQTKDFLCISSSLP